MQTLPTWPDTPEKLERARGHFDRFREFSLRYGGDASLRARLEAGDVSDSLAALGIDLPDGVEARIVADTPGTMHFVLPPDPNAGLADEALGGLAGGKSASTVGTVGSVGTFVCSTAPSSVGSVGTIASAEPG